MVSLQKLEMFFLLPENVCVLEWSTEVLKGQYPCIHIRGGRGVFPFLVSTPST